MKTITSFVLCVLCGCSVEKTGLNVFDGSADEVHGPRRGPISSPAKLDSGVDLLTPADLIVPTDLSAPDLKGSQTPDATSTNRDGATITVDLLPDVSPTPDTAPDLGRYDIAPDLQQQPSTPDVSPGLGPDVSPDLRPDLAPDFGPDLGLDLRKDLSTPDLSPNLPQGTSCSRNSDCRSSFCTDGVCCEVAKCVDTCIPGSSACTPYNGFTCAPFGTCRGF